MTADRPVDAASIELRDELGIHHRDAYAWALNCCRRHRTDAEDVLQATYVKVLEGRARYDRRSSFRTWLFAVIRLTAADYRRRAFVRDLVFERVAREAWVHEPVPAADADLEQAGMRTELACAVASLPRRQREVVLLVFYHEMTLEEAARVMHVGVGSARQHYSRGKAKLCELLGHLKLPA